MNATAYPLTWPNQFPRRQHPERGAFKTALTAALQNVQDSLRRFAADSGRKVDGLVISSKVTLGVQKPACWIPPTTDPRFPLNTDPPAL